MKKVVFKKAKKKYDYNNKMKTILYLLLICFQTSHSAMMKIDMKPLTQKCLPGECLLEKTGYCIKESKSYIAKLKENKIVCVPTQKSTEIFIKHVK